jgi:hypothetical protein
MEDDRDMYVYERLDRLEWKGQEQSGEGDEIEREDRDSQRRETR